MKVLNNAITKMKRIRNGHVCFRLWLLLMVCCCTFPVQASSDIDIGLVVSQFSAELVTGDSFTATEPDGKKTLFEKGKYFIAVNQGKIVLGDHLFPGGTVLQMPENKDLPADSKSLKKEQGKKHNETPDNTTGSLRSFQEDKVDDNEGIFYPRRFFTVNRQDYRGILKVYVTGEGKNLTIVNSLPMEYYVNSVLGPKSSPIWPDEAIKAQAVAVRSLAWYHKNNPESELFAVRAVEPQAFYGGIKNENKNITRIAAKTAGEVLYYGGHPAAAYTCESSGGKTASAEEVLQKSIPYLLPVEDFDTDCPAFKWEKQIQAATIRRIFEQSGHKIGRLRGYRLSDMEKPDPKDRFPSGRVRYIHWQGETGTVTMTGQEFADLLALNSNWFEAFAVDPVPEKLDVSIENGYGMEIGKKQIPIKIKGPDKSAWQSVIPGFHFLDGTKEETILFRGKGLGNGLGLSKWGAKGMADTAPEKAVNYYQTILRHYYPGTCLISAY